MPSANDSTRTGEPFERVSSASCKSGDVSDVDIAARLLSCGDTGLFTVRSERKRLKPFEQPRFISFQIAGQQPPLRHSGDAVPMNDLAQHGLINADCFGESVLMAAATENLEF